VGIPVGSVSELLVEKTGRFYFASTQNGPYVFDNQNQTWSDINSGNAGPKFDGMSAVYIESENIMRFSTFGQGTWDFKIEAISTSSSAELSSSMEASSSVLVSSSGTSSVEISSSELVSSSAIADICEGVSEWTSKEYNWSGTKEYVVYDNKLYSHTNWAGSDIPENNSAWTLEGNCSIQLSSSIELSSSLEASSSGVIVDVQANLNTALGVKSWGATHIRFEHEGTLWVKVLDLKGKVHETAMTEGGQLLSWNTPLRSGQWIIEAKHVSGVKRWMINIK
jgi:hypothetical protein